jgi:hypothetical protein
MCEGGKNSSFRYVSSDIRRGRKAVYDYQTNFMLKKAHRDSERMKTIQQETCALR